jgi:hypothetical protein
VHVKRLEARASPVYAADIGGWETPEAIGPDGTADGSLAENGGKALSGAAVAIGPDGNADGSLAENGGKALSGAAEASGPDGNAEGADGNADGADGKEAEPEGRACAE